jgi:hypothetical protein
MKKFLMTVALGVAVAFAPAPAVQAQTTPEVLAALGFSQAQIQTVMALLDSQTPVVATGESLLSDHDGVNLQVGVNSPRVMELQACMNQAGYNTGRVDGNFGPNTAAGVRAFQTATAGLRVDGIVGMMTTPAFQAACPVTVAAPVAGTLPAGCTSTEGFSVTTGERCDSEGSSEPTNPEFPDNDGQEADIEESDTSKGDADDVYANTEEQSVAMFEIEVDEDGGDLQVDRVDVYVEVSAGTGSDGDELDLNDIIERITLEVDGDEVASEDTDDEDDWRNLTDSDSKGYFRLSNVNQIIEAGDTVEFDVLFDIADLDNDDDLPIDVKVSFEIRYTDETGITEEYKVNEDSSGGRGVEEFTIEALDDVDFDLDENNDNPEDYTVSLDEDADDVVMLVNDVTVDEQGGTLEDVVVTYTFTTAFVGGAGEDLDLDIDDLVNEAYLSLDGDDFEADDIDIISTTANGVDGNVGGGDDIETVTGFTASFDVDDIDFDSGDEWELVAWLDLEELADGSVFIGSTLELDTIEFQGEGKDEEDFNGASSTETADNAPEVSLSAGALLLEESDVDGYNVIGDEQDSADAEIMVEVKADGDEDIRVNGFTFIANGETHTVDLATAGSYTDTISGAVYTYIIEDGDGDDVNAAFVINDGSTEEFTIFVVVDNSGTGTSAGRFRLELDKINWTEDTDGDGDFTNAGGFTLGTLETSIKVSDVTLRA